MRKAVDTTGTITFRASRGKFAWVLTGSLVGAIICMALVPVMLRLATVTLLWPVTFTVLSLYLLINALTSIVRYQRLRRLGDVLTINPDGFCDKRIADVWVPWREVIAVAYSEPVLYFDLGSAERFPPHIGKKLIGRSPYGTCLRIELKSSLINVSTGQLLHYAIAYVNAAGGRTQRARAYSAVGSRPR